MSHEDFFNTLGKHAAHIRELEEELAEAKERIEELEHELDTQTRDNDGYVVIEGVYEELE